MSEQERDHAFEQIGSELRVMGRRFKALVAERAVDLHPQLQPASYYLLIFLIENGATRGSALADQFHIDKGAISRQVQHLVDLGLAERAADPEDGRAQLVSASSEAIERYKQAASQQARRWEAQLGEWSDEELHDFGVQLGRFNDDLA